MKYKVHMRKDYRTAARVVTVEIPDVFDPTLHEGALMFSELLNDSQTIITHKIFAAGSWSLCERVVPAGEPLTRAASALPSKTTAEADHTRSD